MEHQTRKSKSIRIFFLRRWIKIIFEHLGKRDEAEVVELINRVQVGGRGGTRLGSPHRRHFRNPQSPKQHAHRSSAQNENFLAARVVKKNYHYDDYIIWREKKKGESVYRAGIEKHRTLCFERKRSFNFAKWLRVLLLPSCFVPVYSSPPRTRSSVFRCSQPTPLFSTIFLPRTNHVTGKFTRSALIFPAPGSPSCVRVKLFTRLILFIPCHSLYSPKYCISYTVTRGWKYIRTLYVSFFSLSLPLSCCTRKLFLDAYFYV